MKSTTKRNEQYFIEIQEQATPRQPRSHFQQLPDSIGHKFTQDEGQKEFVPLTAQTYSSAAMNSIATD